MFRTRSCYFTVMLPAVTVAVGNATALRINPRLPAEAVTVKGTPGRAGVPSPMSTVAVPLKVALPSAPTDPPLTSPSTVMFCAAPRSEVPTTARHRDARASLKCLPSDGGECWVTGAPAARAGKAILLEKPLAARPRDARRISRAVRRTGVPAMIAHTPRFDPRVRARLREVRKLGPVRAVHVIQHLPSRGVRWESERPHGPPALARRGGMPVAPPKLGG